jgi:hypothetical protein
MRLGSKLRAVLLSTVLIASLPAGITAAVPAEHGSVTPVSSGHAPPDAIRAPSPAGAGTGGAAPSDDPSERAADSVDGTTNNSTQESSKTATPPVVVGTTPATDPTRDGLFEDVNGDGRVTAVDAHALLSHLGDTAVDGNTEKFDYNGDGTVDLVDVTLLFDSATDDPPGDTDGDGLPSQYERRVLGTDPTSIDSDSARTVANESANGIVDGREDFDGDGIPTSLERRYGTDPLAADTDGDGLDDATELRIRNLSATEADSNGDGTSDGNTDSDGDGLSNSEEIRRGTALERSDTDNDGIDDGREVALGTDPVRQDTDTDGVHDGVELRLGTDPSNPDSNDDGVGDGNSTYSVTISPPNSSVAVNVTGPPDVATDVSVATVRANVSDELVRSDIIRVINRTRFDEATISFDIPDGLDRSAERNLTVVTLSPGPNESWERVETNVSGGRASATVTEFSYIAFAERALLDVIDTYVPGGIDSGENETGGGNENGGNDTGGSDTLSADERTTVAEMERLKHRGDETRTVYFNVPTYTGTSRNDSPVKRNNGYVIEELSAFRRDLTGNANVPRWLENAAIQTGRSPDDLPARKYVLVDVPVYTLSRGQSNPFSTVSFEFRGGRGSVWAQGIRSGNAPGGDPNWQTASGNPKVSGADTTVSLIIAAPPTIRNENVGRLRMTVGYADGTTFTRTGDRGSGNFRFATITSEHQYTIGTASSAAETTEIIASKSFERVRDTSIQTINVGFGASGSATGAVWRVGGSVSDAALLGVTAAVQTADVLVPDAWRLTTWADTPAEVPGLSGPGQLSGDQRVDMRYIGSGSVCSFKGRTVNRHVEGVEEADSTIPKYYVYTGAMLFRQDAGGSGSSQTACPADEGGGGGGDGASDDGSGRDPDDGDGPTLTDPVESFNVTSPGTDIRTEVVATRELDSLRFSVLQGGETVRTFEKFDMDVEQEGPGTYRYTDQFVAPDENVSYTVRMEKAVNFGENRDWANNRTRTVTVNPDVVQLNLTANRTRVSTMEPVRFVVERERDGFFVSNPEISASRGSLEVTPEAGFDGVAVYEFEKPGVYEVTATKQRSADDEYAPDTVTVRVVENGSDTPGNRSDVSSSPGAPWGITGGNNARTKRAPSGIEPVTDPVSTWEGVGADVGVPPWATPSPVVANETVYVNYGRFVFARNATNGSVRWQMSLSNQVQSSGEEPALTDLVLAESERTGEQTLYATYTNENATRVGFARIDPADGSVEFTKSLRGDSEATDGKSYPREFAVVDGVAFVPVSGPLRNTTAPDAPAGGSLVAIDIATQETLWRHRAGYVDSVAATTDGVYTVLGPSEPSAGTVPSLEVVKFAADAEKQRVWSYTPEERRWVPHVPVVSNGAVYVQERSRPTAGPGQSVRLQVLDASTGEIQWNVSATGEVPTPVPFDPVSIRVTEPVSPAVTDDRVFLAGWSQNTTLVAVNKSTQRVELNVTVGRDERIVSSQIVAGEVLYVATEDTVAAVDTNNANVLWDVRVSYPFPTLAVGRETLLFDEYSSLVALRNQSQLATSESVPSRRPSLVQLESTGPTTVDQSGIVAAGHSPFDSIRWRHFGTTPDSVGGLEENVPPGPARRPECRCGAGGDLYYYLKTQIREGDTE